MQQKRIGVRMRPRDQNRISQIPPDQSMAVRLMAMVASMPTVMRKSLRSASFLG